MNKIKTACALLLILTVSACGGGGGSSASNNGGSSQIVNFPYAPGAGGDGDPVTANTLAGVITALDEVGMAIGLAPSDDGLIAAPKSIPSTGSATLNGYVGIGDINVENIIDVGHLTIVATFGAGMSGTVETTATGFSEFNIANRNSPDATGGISGGTLGGTGTITGTTITSTLGGTLIHSGKGPIDIVSTFVDGKVYDNGGRLLVHGDVQGTATPADGGGYDVVGIFVANEARPSE